MGRPVEFLKIKTVSRIMIDYPLMLDGRNRSHVAAFKRLLEWSMTQGRWSGSCAKPS